MEIIETVRAKHALPALPYPHAALEPHIDTQTMLLHHDKHHASYVDNLNTAIEKYPDLRNRTATWLLLNPTRLPGEAQTAIRNNAGGHVNHSMFWRAMSPDGGGEPGGALADAIKHQFGSFEKLKAAFEDAAIKHQFGSFEKLKAAFEDAGAKHFASGWVWLTRSQQDGGGLEIVTTAGHGNPVVQGRYPLLLNDVWEHAYYLKHENRRADYLKNWWSVVNWAEAERNFNRSDQPLDSITP